MTSYAMEYSTCAHHLQCTINSSRSSIGNGVSCLHDWLLLANAINYSQLSQLIALRNLTNPTWRYEQDSNLWGNNQLDFEFISITSKLNTQQYKVRIKGKVEQSRERSSALPYNSVSQLMKREHSGRPRLRLATFSIILDTDLLPPDNKGSEREQV